MIVLKCWSYVARVCAAIVLDFSDFLSCAKIRTTGITDVSPLGTVVPGGGCIMPFGCMHSSLTGVGSPTSQSLSSIMSGRPISSETMLLHVSLTPHRGETRLPIPIIDTPPYSPSHFCLHWRIWPALRIQAYVLCSSNSRSQPHPAR